VVKRWPQHAVYIINYNSSLGLTEIYDLFSVNYKANGRISINIIKSLSQNHQPNWNVSTGSKTVYWVKVCEALLLGICTWAVHFPYLLPTGYALCLLCTPSVSPDEFRETTNAIGHNHHDTEVRYLSIHKDLLITYYLQLEQRC